MIKHPFKNHLLIKSVCLLIFASLLSGCKEDQKKTIDFKLDRKNGTVSLKANNKALSDILKELHSSEGLKVFIPEFKDRTVSIVLDNRPIREAFSTLLGSDTKYWLIVERGELSIPGSAGYKEGKKLAARSELPKKGPVKKTIPPPIDQKGNFKSDPLEVKMIQSKGEKGAKGIPSQTLKIEEATGPKSARKEEKPVEGTYGRIRFRMEQGKITLDNVLILPGIFVSTLILPDDYVYGVEFDNSLVAVGSFRDPLVRHTYYPEPEKPHEVIRAKFGYFDVTLPGEYFLDKNLRSLKLNIYRMVGPPPFKIITLENFKEFQKMLKEVKSIGGLEFRGKVKDLVGVKKEENQ